MKKVVPHNLILTQSLHLKYTCGKRAVSNSSSLYTLFYSVIYNSVGATVNVRAPPLIVPVPFQNVAGIECVEVKANAAKGRCLSFSKI